MSTLLNYLIGATTFEWKSMRHAADVAPVQGLKSVDYSTLSKRLSELNYLIVKRIFELIISRLNPLARLSLKLKKRAFGYRLNNHYNREKSLKRTAVEGSNIIADFTCTLGTNQKQTEERHRVVEFIDYEDETVLVVTNLREVTAEEIAGMYKER